MSATQAANVNPKPREPRLRTICCRSAIGTGAKAKHAEMIDNEITGIDVGMTPTEV